jgi:hypothetical protein
MQHSSSADRRIAQMRAVRSNAEVDAIVYNAEKLAIYLGSAELATRHLMLAELVRPRGEYRRRALTALDRSKIIQ